MKSLAHWALLPIRRYVTIGGRSRRREFWSFTLLVMEIGAVLDMLDSQLGLRNERAGWVFGAYGLLGAAFTLATLIPSVTVSVRRLHDVGWSGWWLTPGIAGIVASSIAIDRVDEVQDFQGVEVEMLTALAVLIASCAVMLVVFCLDGTRGPNRFGEDPKRVRIEGVFD